MYKREAASSCVLSSLLGIVSNMFGGGKTTLGRIIDWTASAYYLWWALGVIGALATMAAGLPGIGPVIRNLLYYLGTVLAFTFASSLYLRRSRALHSGSLNPHLVLERTETECWVTPEGFREIERNLYYATAPVDVVVFTYVVSGTGTLELALRSAGELRGPVVREDTVFYQVVLAQPLQRREKFQLELEVTVADPQRTMKPFFTFSYARCARSTPAEILIHFLGGKVHRVFYDERKLDSGPLQVPIVELFPSRDGSVIVRIPAIQSRHEYSVSWSWQELKDVGTSG